MSARTNLNIWTVIVAFVLITAAPTFAESIIYVDAYAAGANDGSSWADAFNYLQDALAAAWSGDEIHVAQGIYKPDQGTGNTPGDRYAAFQLINGVTLKGSYAGIGEPDPDVRDIELYDTILSGDLYGDDGPDFANNGENSYHVVTGSGIDAIAVLDGFTITAGNANGSEDNEGGGMCNSSSSPTVNNCVFSTNSATHGGGMYNWDNSNPTLTNCTFSKNSADRAGGMLNRRFSNPTLTNCTFTDNSATTLNGGGMDNLWVCRPTLTNCTFRGNSAAQYGGGLDNYLSSPTLTNCTFTDNSAEDGGGMYNRSESNPTLTKCTFSGNSAEADGGGMFNAESSPTLSKCTFTSNSAWFGGAVYNDTKSPAFTDCIFSNNSAWLGGAGMYNQNSNPTLENCTFSSNKVEFDGGGMYNQDSSPILTMCTFSDNLTLDGDGGGMYNVHGGPTLTNCTFSGNSSFWDGGGMSNYKSSPTLTNCIFSTNFADEYGGGIENRESDPTLTKCMFTGNWANCGGGAGIANWYSNPILSNCMFSGNTVGERWGDAGGGMLNIASSSVVLTNCTFTGNSAPDGNALACLSRYWYHDPPSDLRLTNCILWDGDNGIWNNNNSAINITYSDVQGSWKGEGNIDADPCFVSPGYWGHEDDPNIIVEPNDPYAMWFDGDYHLLSDSPCINAGDPDYVSGPNETDLDGKPRIIGCQIDMGAYEYGPPVPAEVKIVPHTINLASKGKWITVFLWLPEEYDVADIDPNSVFLEDEIKPDQFSVDEEKQVATASFAREDVQPILEVGDIKLTITVKLTDGTVFEATDVIKVTDKGGGKSPK